MLQIVVENQLKKVSKIVTLRQNRNPKVTLDANKNRNIIKGKFLAVNFRKFLQNRKVKENRNVNVRNVKASGTLRPTQFYSILYVYQNCTRLFNHRNKFD